MLAIEESTDTTTALSTTGGPSSAGLAAATMHALPKMIHLFLGHRLRGCRLWLSSLTGSSTLTGQIRRASLALHRTEIGRHHRRLAPSGSRPFLPFAALSFHLPAFLEGEYSFQCLDRRASTDGLAYCGEVSFHSPRSGSSTTLIVCAVATS